jgi:hypothetical protein
MPTNTLEKRNLDACRQYQAFFDHYLQRIGAKAPQPTPGQDVNDYRAEVCRTLKRTYLPQVHPMAKVNYRRLVADDNLDVLKNFEPQLINAVLTEAVNPANVPKGEMRAIPEWDEGYNVVKSVKFIGQDSFTRQFTIPGRRAHFWNDLTKEFYPPKRPQRTA